MMLQRLDANSFSGWISYSYGRNRYHDTVSQETYWGDLDQRHTFNLYGTYRMSPRTSVSGKLRMGSNFPAPGYYDESTAVITSARRRTTSGCRRSRDWTCGSTGPSRGRPGA